MTNIAKLVGVVAMMMAVSACETMHSIPYKPSTENVMKIQSVLKADGHKLRLGEVRMAEGVSERPMCRLAGPVKVAPGRTLPQYIHDAFQEELFLAGVYDASSSNFVDGVIKTLSFSSIAPASWDIEMAVGSGSGAGYTVSVHYPFHTSWSAAGACRNVADAFGPAVQALLKEVVSDPRFGGLVK